MNVSLDSIIDLSVDLGANIQLVQGAGGNVSLKIGNDLWIKASGTWLADARRRMIFVRLSLDKVRARLTEDSDNLSGCYGDNSGLRPSIETTLHAVMRQSIVVHVHSIKAISWSVRNGGRAEVAKRLSGIPWVWVDYVRPGLPLTLAAQSALLSQGDSSVLLLANHGLLVAGETISEVRALLDQVESRLEIPLRPVTAGTDFASISDLMSAGSRLPANPKVHLLAYDPLAPAYTRGALFPDHAVFLGTSLPMVSKNDVPRLIRTLSESPFCAIVPSMGVLLGPSFSRNAEAVLECLALLVPTLPQCEDLRFLTDGEIGDLLGWEAEKYRQGISGSPTQGASAEGEDRMNFISCSSDNPRTG